MSDDHDIARRVQEMLSASGGRVASEASSNVSEGLGSPPRAGSALRPSLESEPLSVPHARELSQVADVLLRYNFPGAGLTDDALRTLILMVLSTGVEVRQSLTG